MRSVTLGRIGLRRSRIGLALLLVAIALAGANRSNAEDQGVQLLSPIWEIGPIRRYGFHSRNRWIGRFILLCHRHESTERQRCSIRGELFIRTSFQEIGRLDQQ